MSTWKNVGMTYLKYADLCATHLRNALKEPAKSKSLARSDMHARVITWEAGKRATTGEWACPCLHISPILHSDLSMRPLAMRCEC